MGAAMVDAAGYRHWTDAELELLADRSLAAADVAAATRRSPKQIAAETGHSLSAVYAKR